MGCQRQVSCGAIWIGSLCAQLRRYCRIQFRSHRAEAICLGSRPLFLYVNMVPTRGVRGSQFSLLFSQYIGAPCVVVAKCLFIIVRLLPVSMTRDASSARVSAAHLGTSDSMILMLQPGCCN